MTFSGKRRREVRYHLNEPIHVQVLLRSLRGGSSRGVKGVLTDVSKSGMGILVQEHVALDTRCYVEVPIGTRVRRFKGEVCYGQRTDYGIKLGIMLAPDNSVSIMEVMESQGISLSH